MRKPGRRSSAGGDGDPDRLVATMRPLIGVTTSGRTLDAGGEEHRVYAAFVSYAVMVRAAGGLPVGLIPEPPDHAADVLDRLDALLLTGGGDVDPVHYGGTSHGEVYGVDPDRDAFELELVRAAADRRVPTLCICRGLQVLNVALGGTLIEDIAAEGAGYLDHRNRDAESTRRRHEVDLEPQSTTARALGAATVMVNSSHHQAVRELAPTLRATGRAADGIVEAVASVDDAWPLWAVQWHPERLGVDDPPSMRLFQALVTAAAHRASRPPHG
jgi:putative glutamine amidotransferase